MQKIPVCDLWARHWAEYEASLSSLRGRDDARSKIGHLALWTMSRTGKPVAAWPGALALLDSASAPGGVAAFVHWKRQDCSGRKWVEDISVTRGCGVLGGFFGFESSVTRGCEASKRIAEAFRAYKP